MKKENNSEELILQYANSIVASFKEKKFNEVLEKINSIGNNTLEEKKLKSEVLHHVNRICLIDYNCLVLVNSDKLAIKCFNEIKDIKKQVNKDLLEKQEGKFNSLLTPSNKRLRNTGDTKPKPEQSSRGKELNTTRPKSPSIS